MRGSSQKKKLQQPANELAGSAHLSVCMIAFGATKELRRRFIRATSLHLPHKSCIVPTLWTFHSHSRKCVEFLFFLPNNSYELLWRMRDYFTDLGFNLLCRLFLFEIPFRANKHH